jgi:hypothetical protein
MKTFKFLLKITFTGILMNLFESNAVAFETANFLPDITGFAKKTTMKYNASDLFNYIDGAADMYLNYGFKELVVATYEKPEMQSITIEIYRHENPDCGFGIYSQERSVNTQNFVNIGSQGYYEAGTLNFFKNCYYVKITGNNVEKEENVFLDVANNIAAKLPGNTNMPDIFSKFPRKGKLVNQDRYVPKNFLGYPCFINVFTCDYFIPATNETFTFFTIVGNSKEDCKKMLESYLNTVKVTNIPVSEGRLTIEDPYYGTVDLYWYDKDIKGIYGSCSFDNRTDYFTFDYAKYVQQIIETNKENLAFKKNATCSSIENLSLKPENATDGDMTTRWSSSFSDPQWICIDLGTIQKINRVCLFWEGARAVSYRLEHSSDGVSWNSLYSTENGDGDKDEIKFNPIETRYVRMNGLKRKTQWGYSLYEIQVFFDK